MMVDGGNERIYAVSGASLYDIEKKTPCKSVEEQKQTFDKKFRQSVSITYLVQDRITNSDN